MPYPKGDNPFEIATKWGRKEATVFTGFCGYHDYELFKPIENYDFDDSDKHVFLYTYRTFALCYERKQLLELTEDERVTYLHKLIPMESENIVIRPSSRDAMDKHQQEDFGMLIWNFGQLYETMIEEPYNILGETSFNLFQL